ncbi:helix-turn-helix transcriptional regulator [Saccharopolyspora sp. K220]|uniref:helix-turn-helix domain-containing protein n=1 Tax=Saccharopolyspora soli TaxID=2926618 RepID=UPI001F592D55|nr:helix-turn-helix transcriptional regulator [Saccharopolyspora soli]MCI2417080.1 helix-turn-helix transcriptional regulator [Saccharopolyspora soli]
MATAGRAELADFLRTRRARIGPDEVGLPVGARRRTPGLRREEVAQLAAVSPTWYTWLEQGRDVRPSAQVLEGIAEVLRLDFAERSYLFQLARGEAPPTLPPRQEPVPDYLRRLVEHLAAPAYLTNRRLDVLVWNAAASAVLGDFGQVPAEQRNSIWLVFTDPRRRTLLAEWQEVAQHLVALLRAASGYYAEDPRFAELVSALIDASPEFRKWWPDHDVAGRGAGRKLLNHPTAGRLALDHTTLVPDEAPELHLVLYTPADEATEAKLAKLRAAS